MISDEKSTVISIFFLFFSFFCHYNQSAFGIFVFVLNVQESDWVCQGMGFYELILSGICWDPASSYLPNCKSFSRVFYKFFFRTTLFLLSSWDSDDMNLQPFGGVPEDPKNLFFFFLIFFFFSFCWIIPTDLLMISTDLLTFFSISSILL